VDDYKIGFAWGFEPMDDEPQGMIKDIPPREAPTQKRTISRPTPPPGKKSPQKTTASKGMFSGLKNWLGKYF
jgi:hypothetical protein